MKEEVFLYRAVILTILGFLIFIGSILNKGIMFLNLLSEYYVLFLFSGLIITIVGVFMIFAWYVNNSSPYLIEKKMQFPSYLAFGMLLVVIGFTAIFQFSNINIGLYYMSLSVSVVGIILMSIGAIYFIKEVLNQKTVSHS